METISFVYNNKTYEGKLRISTVKEPYYYWCYLNDPHLNNEVGECIVFIEERGVLKTPHYYPLEQRTLIESIKSTIVQYSTTTAF